MFNTLKTAVRIAAADVLKLLPGEQVLVITNPGGETEIIARSLYEAALDCGAFPVLILQPVKTQFDFAEEAIIAAFQARPQAVISISTEKLGKDRQGIANPYKYGKDKYDHIFHLLLYGEKSCRSFWSPSTTLESFTRTVPIDYAELDLRCSIVSRILSAAESIHVTAPGGTDITAGLRGREARADDGNFSTPGKGGNLPAGESFISPENGTAYGTIVFDGSISLYKGDIIINDPIRCRVEGGFIKDISGGPEARALEETITMAERDALDHEKAGRLPQDQGTVYAKNARNLGELGIGLNPKARITGNMLEDEKAFHTCHFAVGHNYDDDAPSLIHLDGLVKDPTITAVMTDGTVVIIEQDGELQV
ncbi:MAG: aminopeptidase [Treponema sp.]|jgi:leucyl aminopeptidase (aminopeptidase T)|nr:aminopeptidase [Treponema sp.]